MHAAIVENGDGIASAVEMQFKGTSGHKVMKPNALDTT